MSDVKREYLGADLGDQRLNRRLVTLATQLSEEPDKSFPESLEDPADLEAGYRFLENERVTPKEILAPHVRATVERAAEAVVLAIHDTTQFGFRADGKRRGLGRLRSTQQFFSHVTLAVGATEAREPLGVLAVHNFAEKQEEGDRWLNQAKEVSELIHAKRVVHVMDREGDGFATVAGLIDAQARFVIRACDHRLFEGPVSAPTRIRDAHVNARASREVPISLRTNTGRNPEKRKRFPARNARLALLHLGAVEIVLKRPRSCPKTFPEECTLNFVRVWEPSPPAGEVAVEWDLFTTEPINSPEDLLKIIDIYRARWRIEELFKAIKTGCAFEKRQLESFETLINALAIFLPIAWRLLHLRSQVSDKPDALALTILDPIELEVLRLKAKRPLPEKPTRRDALLAIARLGGHLKHNGDPGWQVLGRGLERLLMLAEGFRLAKSDQS